ncbi:MAG: DUF4129 domain-containing protein [Maribacter sp.]|nr:DUF4129 domain-containing protein [Maribacter sp.]MBT8313934.1 DUF4129 domain-containing protein [Maribacter sp.]
MVKRLFIILFTGISICGLKAQQDSTPVQYDNSELHLQQISEEDVLIYKEDPKFDYEIVEAELTWWENFKTWLGNLLLQFFEWLFGVEKATGYLSIFFRLIPYILIGILLFLFIKFFLKVNSSALLHTKENEAVATLSEEEHIIKHEDINELIQNALKEKNYRLAIRYYYLLILRQMSEKGLIDWEIQKTNDDYSNELKKKSLKVPFGHITRLYDYIWYGDFPISETNYRRAENTFATLKEILENHD